MNSAFFCVLPGLCCSVLSVGGLLPHPCSIVVLPPEDQPAQGEGVLGLALPKKNTIWFKQQPPDPVVFAHELIHLIKQKPRKLEEIYAYDLAPLAVILAKRNIMPPVNIIKLYDASIEDLLDAVRKAYGYRFRDIGEFFEAIGVIPAFMKPITTSSGELKWAVDERYSEKLIIMIAVGELVAGAEYDELMLSTLIELLKILS